MVSSYSFVLEVPVSHKLLISTMEYLTCRRETKFGSYSDVLCFLLIACSSTYSSRYKEQGLLPGPMGKRHNRARLHVAKLSCTQTESKPFFYDLGQTALGEVKAPCNSAQQQLALTKQRCSFWEKQQPGIQMK